MSDALHITVLTPERAVLDEDVYSVTAPGAAGYLGILKNHAALITSLVPGKLTVKNLRQQPTVYAVSGGFLEVANNKVTVLADTLLAVDEIDLADVQECRKQAERRREAARTPHDKEQAEADLARIENLIRIKRHPEPSV
ncbi:MAG: F-type H+-transporting ATPase subunit epsilon [bacterium]|nr:MAG: F-type H+-transporting ATPase subunit epsilon [bacterium]